MALTGHTKRNAMHVIVGQYLKARQQLGMEELYHVIGNTPINQAQMIKDNGDDKELKLYNQWCGVLEVYYKALAENNSRYPLQAAEIRKQLFTLRFVYLINDSQAAEILGLNKGAYSRHKKPVVDTFMTIMLQTGLNEDTAKRLATYAH